MAGTGKRAGHKRTWINRYIPDYFGKHGFKSLKQKAGKKLNIINLHDIQEKLAKFLQTGLAKKTLNGIELNLRGYKVLGTLRGEFKVKEKLIIKASQVSASAKAKIEKAGCKVELIN